MLRALASLRTTLLVLGLLVLLAAFGSFAVQWHPQAYSAIEESTLFAWLRTEAVSGASWWVLGMIGATALLSLNACVCVALSLARGLRRGALPLRTLWAHAAHLGFLLVLGGHLIGSVWGFRSDRHSASSGESFRVPPRPGWTVSVRNVSVRFAPEGYPSSLDAALSVWEDRRLVAEGVARVNHPVFVRGAAIYLKDVTPSLCGWTLETPAGPALVRWGVPLALPGGSFLLRGWDRTHDGRTGVYVVWTRQGAAPLSGWVAPAPGELFVLPSGPTLRWGEMAVDALGTFDVRYDPGARLVLLGGLLLSVSLIPLLRPRRPKGASGSEPPPAVPPENADSTCDMAAR